MLAREDDHPLLEHTVTERRAARREIVFPEAIFMYDPGGHFDAISLVDAHSRSFLACATGSRPSVRDMLRKAGGLSCAAPR